jgi:hypothetical protein
MTQTILQWKPQVVRINISSTFVIKNKCVECNKQPDEYYWVNLAPYYYDVRSAQWLFDWYKKYVKRMTGSWYMKRAPKHFHLIRDFNFYWTEKSFKPALHHKLNVEATDHVIEYLACPCGRTVWAFNQKDGEERPEIKHRKGRYGYPQKFESF